MKNDKQFNLTCRNCPFYSGVQCHGHGEYWGTCGLLSLFHKTIKPILPKHVYTGEHMFTVRFDDSNCLLQTSELIYIDDLRDEK